jgi:hypothetical protein
MQLLPLPDRTAQPGMIVRAAGVAAATVIVMVLLSLVFPALGNRAALVVVPGVIAGLSLVKSRRLRLELGVAATFVFAIVAWAVIQPSYL